MMVNLGKPSSLKPQQVIRQTVNFFGPQGEGLRVIRQKDDRVRLEGGGGYVYVQASPKPAGSQIDVEGQEWTAEIKQFLVKV